MINWSVVKRSVLIGTLSSPYFALQTAKMDSTQTDFKDLKVFWKGI